MLCLFVVVVVFISKEKKAKDGVTKYKDISRERHKQRKVRKKKKGTFFSLYHVSFVHNVSQFVRLKKKKRVLSPYT